MQISEIESKKLLPQWAHAIDWIQAAFDTIVRNGSARIPAIDAPLTMDAIRALTDAELQEWYARFDVVQYYPDLSRETRENMLYWLARLYRYLGTQKAVEILCKYIHDGAPMSVSVRDNLAWDGTMLDDEALLDLFDVEIDAESSQITPLLAYRIAQNIYRIARNSQTLREIVYSYAAHIDVQTAAISEECGVTIGDSGIAQLPPMDLILVDDATGRVVNGGMFGDTLELAAVQVSNMLVQPACGAIMQGVLLGTVQLDPQVGVELVDVAAFPTVSEITVYTRNEKHYYQPGVTTQTTTENPSYIYDLYTNSACTDAFSYDPGSLYLAGNVSNGLWKKLIVQSVLDMPSTTTPNGADSTNTRIINSSGKLWMVSNFIGGTLSDGGAQQKVVCKVCSSNLATVITVYNASNVAYSAFMYTHPLYGSDYYYALDGVQTDWTDDLDSIGYNFTPRGYFNQNKSNKSLNAYSSTPMYDPSGNPIQGDSTKTYTILAWYLANGTVASVGPNFYIQVMSDGYLRMISSGSSGTAAYVEYTVS